MNELFSIEVYLKELLHNLARLRKTDLIEHQPNLYNNYNIIDSKNYGFLSLIIQKVRSGKQSVHSLVHFLSISGKKYVNDGTFHWL